LIVGKLGHKSGILDCGKILPRLFNLSVTSQPPPGASAKMKQIANYFVNFAAWIGKPLPLPMP
jgi:hypothetical protein